MKLKYFLAFFYLLFITAVFGQSKNKSHHKTFVPKKYFNTYYSKKDSLGFIIKNNDTLISVNRFIKPDGIGVPYEPKDSTFLEIYKPIAFQPSKKEQSDSQPMKYWKDEIKIFFTPNISKKVRRKLLRFTNLIDLEVDSLNIVNVKLIDEANYIVYSENDFEYEDNLKNISTSGYYIHWNKKNQITKGFVKLNTKILFSDLLQIQKIKQEFVLSLGWFLPYNKLDCSSYFSACFSDKKKLSKLDLEILKYHYSYGICKGTRLKRFEEQHSRAKKVLKNSKNTFIIYHQD